MASTGRSPPGAGPIGTWTWGKALTAPRPGCAESSKWVQNGVRQNGLGQVTHGARAHLVAPQAAAVTFWPLAESPGCPSSLRCSE